MSALESLRGHIGSVFDHATPVLQAATRAVVAGASPAIDVVKGGGEHALAAASAFGESVAQHAPEPLKEIKQSIDRRIDEKKEWVGQLRDQLTSSITERIQRRMQQVLVFVTGFVIEKVRDGVKPDEAPAFVQRWTDEVVNTLAPDIEIELRESILSLLQAKITDPDADGTLIDMSDGSQSEMDTTAASDEGCCFSGCLCRVAWWPIAQLRHAMNPFNHSIWWQLKHPLFWIFTIISLVPRYAVGQILYLLWFLIIDKSDYYQLLKYMVDFKGLMWLNGGVISGFVGLGQLYVCSVGSSCPRNAPKEEYFTLLVFAVQEIVVWLAFALSFCAERRGGFAHQYDVESSEARRNALLNPRTRRDVLDFKSCVVLDEPDKVEEEHVKAFHNDDDDLIGHIHENPSRETSGNQPSSVGNTANNNNKSMFGVAISQLRYTNDDTAGRVARHRLVWFLIYDMVVFFLAIGAIAFSAFYNVLDPNAEVRFSDYDTLTSANWKFLLTIYVVRCMYGLLSAPFVLLQFPVSMLLITHARSTGYDRHGRTLAVLRMKKQKST